MTHPCEPSLDTLKYIHGQLYGLPSTEENMRKISAIKKQIARREREDNEPES